MKRRRGVARRVVLVAIALAGLVTSSSPVGAARSHGILVLRRTDTGMEIARVNPTSDTTTTLVAEQSLTSSQWSPDGRWISWRADDGDDIEVYVARADGKRRRAVTDDDRNDYGVDWAPGSDRLVYVGWTTTRAELFVTDARGRNTRRLTNDDRLDIQPDWSPAGGRIAYTHSTDYKSFIYTVSPRGGKPRRLTGGMAPRYSPDGSKILFVRNGKKHWRNDLFVMRSDGTGVKRLTRSRAYEDEYSWAPDGSGIAFVRTRWESPEDHAQSIWHMKANGRGQKRLTSGDLSAATGYTQPYYPTWSLSSHRVAYLRYDLVEGSTRTELWVVRLGEVDGTALDSPGDTVHMPNWHSTPVELQNAIS